MADPQALEIGIGGHLRALLKARCFACVKLSRHGPFGPKAASTKFAVWPASRLACTQTTQRGRRRIQPSAYSE
jgi:hypothetical protein